MNPLILSLLAITAVAAHPIKTPYGGNYGMRNIDGVNLGFNGMFGYGVASNTPAAMAYGLTDFGASYAGPTAAVSYASSPLAMPYGLSAGPAAYNMHEISAPLMNYQPAPMSYAMPEPIQMASPVMQYAAVAPAPVQAVMHYSAPQVIGSQVHYENRPVVTGYTSEILKPALGAYVAGLDEPIVSKQKVLAPVRTHSQIAEQVTVQHPTKVNVEKVLYDVEVPTPVAQPYAVPITPQIDVHTVQHVPAPYAVPHVAQPAPIMSYAMPEPIQAAPVVNYAPAAYMHEIAAPALSYSSQATLPFSFAAAPTPAAGYVAASPYGTDLASSLPCAYY